MRIAKTIATWTLQILLCALFLMVGTGKFLDPGWARRFARWGYPDGFHLIIGVVEALAGLALLVPRFTAYAAVLLMVVMTGAALTHLTFGETRQFTSPLVFLVLLSLVGWLRKDSAATLPRSASRSASRSDEAKTVV
jgi:uncharacterized membrane protein YphA (DoxX/SURF4 family)